MSATCYHCNVVLNDSNRSEEHIIPNALGGRWTSYNLLCRQCNSAFGHSMDTAFVKSWHPIAALLGIERENGEHPQIKNLRDSKGELYHLKDGRTPTFVKPTIKVDEENKVIHIRARDEKEARHIIERLKKNYPGIDDSNLESKLIPTNQYMDDTLHMALSLGGSLYDQALIKMAVSAWLVKTQDRSPVSNCIDLLSAAPEKSSEFVQQYYNEELIEPPSSDRVTHVIYMKADPATNLLYAYIELFSSAAYIVHLNKEYAGPFVEFNYSFDVLTTLTENRAFPIEHDGLFVTGEAASALFIQILQKKMSRVFAISQRRQAIFQGKMIVRNAINDINERLRQKTLQPEEIRHELARVLVIDLTKLMVHIQKDRHPSNKKS